MPACDTGMERLPLDVVVVICSNLALPDVLSFLGSTRVLRDCMSGDSETFFRTLALSWHGEEFWRRALSRITRRTYMGMRAELIAMHRFQSQLLSCGFPQWTHADFEAFWKWEEDATLRQLELARNVGAVP